MCIAMRPAHFADTTVYAGETDHRRHGRIHVLGYQNRMVNYADGPNAMLLHIPAGEPMTEDNFVDTRGCRSILSDMAAALNLEMAYPAAFREGTIATTAAMAVQVFQHGIYTVVLSQNAALIPDALARVPVHQRPPLNPPLFEFYAREFPDWCVALCCFDNREAARADPLLLWYYPMDAEWLRWPALDCHTGAIPDINAHVAVDHWVIAGSDRFSEAAGQPVTYQDACPPAVGDFLPNRVIGRAYRRAMRNGDFVLRIDDLLNGSVDRIVREPAPSAMRPTLTVLEPDRPERVCQLGNRPVAIGRAQACEVVLADRVASRLHARIAPADDAYVLFDANSTNGIMVNGRRVAGAYPLNAGDRIQIGNSTLSFDDPLETASGGPGQDSYATLTPPSPPPMPYPRSVPVPDPFVSPIPPPAPPRAGRRGRSVWVWVIFIALALLVGAGLGFAIGVNL